MNIKEIDGVKYISYAEHEKLVLLAIQLERDACAAICEHEMEFGLINKAMGVAAGNCLEKIINRSDE